MVTADTCPESTQDMKSLNETGRSRGWSVVEKFQTNTPTITRTNQNRRLFRVEFTHHLPTG